MFALSDLELLLLLTLLKMRSNARTAASKVVVRWRISTERRRPLWPVYKSASIVTAPVFLSHSPHNCN